MNDYLAVVKKFLSPHFDRRKNVARFFATSYVNAEYYGENETEKSDDIWMKFVSTTSLR